MDRLLHRKECTWKVYFIKKLRKASKTTYLFCRTKINSQTSNTWSRTAKLTTESRTRMVQAQWAVTIRMSQSASANRSSLLTTMNSISSLCSRCCSAMVWRPMGLLTVKWLRRWWIHSWRRAAPIRLFLWTRTCRWWMACSRRVQLKRYSKLTWKRKRTNLNGTSERHLSSHWQLTTPTKRNKLVWMRVWQNFSANLQTWRSF